MLDLAVQTCSRRRFVRQFAPVFGAPLLASCGLIDVSETSTSRKLKISQNFPSCSIARVGFAKPVVSLSMGISEFQDAAWRSTPAHGLGANMMYELLRPNGDACLDITGRLGRCDALADTTIRLKPGTLEAESASTVLCELAFARIFAGQTSRAIGESREGVDLMRMPDANGQYVIDGFLVRAMFKAAAIHFRAGRVLRGFQLYSEASGHARDKHLDDQYRQWRPWALIERAKRHGQRLRR